MQTGLCYPKANGFFMPAEFSPHSATIMIFPERLGSWTKDPTPSRRAFARAAAELVRCEQVYMLVNERTRSVAESMLPPAVQLLSVDTDDAWARDIAPTFVINGKGGLCGISWQFNAWGGDVDGLYPDYEKDDLAADRICELLHIPCYSARPFVLEGGAIHSDGEGTLLVTEACLLSKGRNPKMTKQEITETLCRLLGAQKVIWLPYGIYLDETNEHIDNICAFAAPAHVLLAWCDNPNDPQYEMSCADLEVLERESDARGRSLRVTKLPIPHQPICVTKEQCQKFSFAKGEAIRTVGERLAASYVNFYIGNDCVLVPQFGGIYQEDDSTAQVILRDCFPGRRILPIPANDILLGGGNLHCITQQIPRCDGFLKSY